MFSSIQLAPTDPILGLNDAFQKDPRPQKINLGVGIYKDNHDKTPILASVSQAEQQLLREDTTKSYLAIDGLFSFQQLTQELLFGKSSPVILEQRAKTVQSIGGTGALRLVAEFLQSQTSSKRIWISKPTWPNHLSIFQAVGMKIKEYRYYDAENHGLDWQAMLEDLSEAQEGDVILLHGCCHNPTGVDPIPEQWQQLSAFCAEKKLLPLFDLAYQGLANGLEEDTLGLKAFLTHHRRLLVANSYSKNFGLYNERVGAFTLVADNSQEANHAHSQIKRIIRVLYSNPPYHGAAIVQHILSTPHLRQSWETELTELRQRIKAMRSLLVEKLKDYAPQKNFDFILQQNGMFSFSGLTPSQVECLQKDFSIYMVRSGRINVAGIRSENVDYLCQGIEKVL